MHNGGIAEFNKIKRTLQQSLPDNIFEVVQGNTDSEWAFALFLSKLPDAGAKSLTTAVLKQAMFDTITHLNEIADKAEITEVSVNQEGQMGSSLSDSLACSTSA
jgi:predicted glutamine amidotransferase